MNLIFGMNLDRGTYPRPHHRNGAVLGKDACGPLKLLRILETQLGLGGPRPDSVARTDAYRRKLKSADDGRRFYSKSFQRDPLGVARTLLRWRDELVLAGLTMSAHADLPLRFMDLARAETAPSGEALPEGIADRLIMAEKVLRGGQASGLKAISLADPRDLLPPFWQRLFAFLEKSGVTITESKAPPIGDAPAGDLQRVQNALAANGKADLQGDGSLIILHSASDNESADVLAPWLGRLPQGESLLIHPYDKRTLDTALALRGFPAIGVNSYSGSRPILKILPLIGGNLWSPFNPQAMLELLSLPMSPIPRRLARRLAAAIANEPGLGGPQWEKAVQSALEAAKKSSDPGKSERDIRSALDDWLDFPRHDPQHGLKKSDGVLVFRKLSAWAAKRTATANESEQRLLRILSAGSANLADLLNQYEIDKIPYRDFLDIVGEVSSGEVLGDDSDPEAGHLPWVPHPSSVISKVPVIVWWDFAGNSTPTQRSFLDTIEREWMQKRDLRMEDPLTAIKRSIRADLSPVFNAGKRLVLIVPRSIAGTELPPHPVLDTLSAIAGKSLALCETTAAHVLAGKTKFAELKSDTVQLPPAGLPQQQSFWTMPEAIRARDKESYSSLNDLLSAPYTWFLNHKAKLKRGNFLTLPNMRPLKGTLAHVMIEELLGAHTELKPLSEADIHEFVTHRFDKLLATRGALLLQPGKETESATFRYMLKNSCTAIVKTLATNGWTMLEAEGSREMAFGGTPFAAHIDVILTCPQRGLAVLDLKDSSFTTYQDKMANGLIHQLILYSRALAEGKAFTPFAYYLIGSGKIVSPDTSAFTGDNVWCPPEPCDHAKIWEQMLTTYRWRLDELRQGRVAIALPPDLGGSSDAQDGAESAFVSASDDDDNLSLPQPPPGTLSIATLADMRTWIDENPDYAVLTGSLESL